TPCPQHSSPSLFAALPKNPSIAMPPPRICSPISNPSACNSPPQAFPPSCPLLSTPTHPRRSKKSSRTPPNPAGHHNLRQAPRLQFQRTAALARPPSPPSAWPFAPPSPSFPPFVNAPPLSFPIKPPSATSPFFPSTISATIPPTNPSPKASWIP